MGRNYLGEIERYHDHHHQIHELLASIVTGLAEPAFVEDLVYRQQVLSEISELYPFINLAYTLTDEGLQSSPNYSLSRGRVYETECESKDRSQRPYFQMASKQEGVVITQPYLSSVDHMLCLSAAIRICRGGVCMGYLVLDMDLSETLSFLMGDKMRTRFEPYFKWVHAAFAIGLFTVVGALIYSAFVEMTHMFTDSGDSVAKPFTSIIYLTLGMAIFDLAKTTLEEEVLTHKDIFRHSTTRRTITRFMASILVAVSIEALLLMFKGAMGQSEYLTHSVWVAMSAVFLLIGLAIYVYLGALSEKTLINNKRL
jgi:hypothetical protein